MYFSHSWIQDKKETFYNLFCAYIHHRKMETQLPAFKASNLLSINVRCCL